MDRREFVAAGICAQVTGVERAAEIRDAIARAVFALPPRLTVSEWADEYRIVSDGNPEPGPWRTARSPYMREIMDAMGDPDIEHIVFMKSARVGATEAVNNFIGWTIDLAPANTMVVHPSGDEAKGWSKEALAPMLTDTPRLRTCVREKPTQRRESGDTMLYKEFTGGFLIVVGSNSASGLRRRNIQNVIGDERDAYTASALGGVGREGDPFELAIKRTENYPTRTIFEASTPTLTPSDDGKTGSPIARMYAKTDQRRYYVPCPHCGHMQVLKWRQMQWVDDDPETVVYVCGDVSKEGELLAGCGESITEEHKVWMVQHGEWRAQYPKRRIRGYHIWAAYSLFTRWPRLVEQWQKAQGNNELLQVFINTVLGETWDEPGEKVSTADLESRAEAYPAEVPAGVGVLTASVDVQADRLELAVKGWGSGQESWLIGHWRLFGDTERLDDVWARLDNMLLRAYQHERGAEMRISATMIDSGYKTDGVYAFVRPRQGRNVFASKGIAERGRPPLQRAQRANKSGVRLFTVGTIAFKDRLFGRLKIQKPGPGFMHFCLPTDSGADAEYYAQFGAERVSTVRQGHRMVKTYVQERERNEAIDLEVLALAALHTLGTGVTDGLERYVVLMADKGEAVKSPAQQIQTPKPRRQTSWVYRGWRE